MIMKKYVLIIMIASLFFACSQNNNKHKEMNAKASSRKEVKEETFKDTLLLDPLENGVDASIANENSIKKDKKRAKTIQSVVEQETATEEITVEEVAEYKKIAISPVKASPKTEKEISKAKKYVADKTAHEAPLGKVAAVQVSANSTKKIALSQDIKAVFLESTQQKTQQIYDTSLLLNNQKLTEDNKQYALENVKRLYLKKENLEKELLKLNSDAVDSIVINKLKLKKITPLGNNSYTGFYKANVSFYKKNKQVIRKTKNIKVLLEIVKLYVDEQVYTTIESKILDIK